MSTARRWAAVVVGLIILALSHPIVLMAMGAESLNERVILPAKFCFERPPIGRFIDKQSVDPNRGLSSIYARHFIVTQNACRGEILPQGFSWSDDSQSIKEHIWDMPNVLGDLGQQRKCGDNIRHNRKTGLTFTSSCNAQLDYAIIVGLIAMAAFCFFVGGLCLFTDRRMACALLVVFGFVCVTGAIEISWDEPMCSARAYGNAT